MLFEVECILPEGTNGLFIKGPVEESGVIEPKEDGVDPVNAKCEAGNGEEGEEEQGKPLPSACGHGHRKCFGKRIANRVQFAAMKPAKVATILSSLLLIQCATQAPAPPVSKAEALEEATAATTVAFTEGPTEDADGNVYFSEIINQRIIKMAPDGAQTIFREHSNNANGLLFDKEWRLIACEGASIKGGKPLGNSPYASTEMKPRVTRTDMKTGKIEVLADQYEGKPFVGPNDVTMDEKGRLYFTDLPGGAVYRIDPDKKLTRILAAPDIQRPNGIAITPDDKTLYLVEANQQAGGARMLRAYDLSPEGTVSNMRVFHNYYPGRSADGMCMDTRGNLYAAAGLHQKRGTSETLDTRCGVYVFSPDGKQIKFISVPEDTITNCTFGGKDMKTLYITAGKGLYQYQNDVAGTRR